MPQCKWQCAEDYVFDDHVTGLDFARDYLVRDPEFIRDCNRLKRTFKRRALRLQEREAFALRWGLEFAASISPKRWHPSASPASLIVVAAFAGSLIGVPLTLFHEPEQKLGISVWHDSVSALTDSGDGLAVLIPLDTLIDVRLGAVRALADQLRARSGRPYPPPLSKQRRTRLLLGLRALDAHLAGASYRDIATVLFGANAVPASGWKTHDTRARTIRLVRDAIALMKGGYRQLLLHPYRGRLPRR